VEEVRQALAGVLDPELKRNLVELGMVHDLTVQGGAVRFTLALTIMACPLKDKIVAEARAAVLALEGVEKVEIALREMTPEERQAVLPQKEEGGAAARFNHIGRVLAVMSGKGGVGKSLVAGLLAVALRREGYTVGVLDADITGPSIPRMFFPQAPALRTTPLGFLPAESSTGIKVMSINLLLPREDEAVIWRGPLIGGAIKQFWGDVVWGDLDVLIVDLPPGTSDASLTVMQSLPVDGIVMVTSPQGLAGMVVRKAARMVRQMGGRMLGLIENMSYALCPDGTTRLEVFGPSHAWEMAAEVGVPLLGQLPIDPRIATMCDAGQIEEYAATEFTPMARQVAQAAGLRPAGIVEALTHKR
jgi:Mrp family chromosome partitioning ATPase